MNKHIVTALAAFVLGGISTGVLLAQAQPVGPWTPPPGGTAMGPPDGGPGMAGPWAAGPWAERMRARMAHRMEMMRAFALIYRAEDRKLTPPDVKKIAEGFLLWNGNRTWQVLNVVPDGDLIGFDLGTKEGSVIAHFTMDSKTGRLRRLG